MHNTPAQLLNIAQAYADEYSGCKKVRVGALLVKDNNILSLGCNFTHPSYLCLDVECMRVQKYGDNAKEHRLPADCRAVHAEISAIARCPVSCAGSTMFVTRYPCEACARAIVEAGITSVFYGRNQLISAETTHIFSEAGIDCWNVDSWVAEDTTI